MVEGINCDTEQINGIGEIEEIVCLLAMHPSRMSQPSFFGCDVMDQIFWTFSYITFEQYSNYMWEYLVCCAYGHIYLLSHIAYHFHYLGMTYEYKLILVFTINLAYFELPHDSSVPLSYGYLKNKKWIQKWTCTDFSSFLIWSWSFLCFTADIMVFARYVEFMMWLQVKK